MTSASATALSTQPRRKRPVTAHPAFAAMLGVWGAALGGLSIMVLPDALIEAGARAAGSDLLISEARLADQQIAARSPCACFNQRIRQHHNAKPAQRCPPNAEHRGKGGVRGNRAFTTGLSAESSGAGRCHVRRVPVALPCLPRAGGRGGIRVT